ncbi:MAG: hypothetical protein EA382_17165 [Spirochaetaceae bacterium]|nr:MAG: hypothetical protein EA382_17165 [Spirochaetaceae bacterium]
MRIRGFGLGLTALLVAGALVATTGCATRAPAEERPPAAEVSELESTVMTPDVVRFSAKVVVHNRMHSAMDFDRVDYTVDLFDAELFTESFADLPRTRGGGRMTITLPFQIAVSDIVERVVDVLAEESMRVTFSGQVYPAADSGFGPLAFRRSVSIPIPRMPEVSYSHTEGVPLTDTFRIAIDVRNRNTYPLTITEVESYIEINERSYPLLQTSEASRIEAGETGRIVLGMELTQGQRLSMLVNTLGSDTPAFAMGGSITARTQYGWIYIPIRIEDRTTRRN